MTDNPHTKTPINPAEAHMHFRITILFPFCCRCRPFFSFVTLYTPWTSSRWTMAQRPTPLHVTRLGLDEKLLYVISCQNRIKTEDGGVKNL